MKRVPNRTSVLSPLHTGKPGRVFSSILTKCCGSDRSHYASSPRRNSNTGLSWRSRIRSSSRTGSLPSGCRSNVSTPGFSSLPPSNHIRLSLSHQTPRYRLGHSASGAGWAVGFGIAHQRTVNGNYRMAVRAGHTKRPSLSSKRSSSLAPVLSVFSSRFSLRRSFSPRASPGVPGDDPQGAAGDCIITKEYLQ